MFRFVTKTAVAALTALSIGSGAHAATFTNGVVAGDFGLTFWLDKTRPTTLTLNIDASQLSYATLTRMGYFSFAAVESFDASGRPTEIYTEGLGTEIDPAVPLDPALTTFKFSFGDRSGRSCSPLKPPYKLCHYVDNDRVVFEGETLGGSQVNYSYSLSAVPEPATWAMMIAGFGLAGAGLRRARGQRRARLAPRLAS